MIIGLTGGMGVGKSTALKILENEFNAKLLKFAQPLYDIQEYIYGRISTVYQRPETFQKDRFLLQWLGTEWGRETISNTLWLDLWKAQAYEMHHDKGLFVVSDDTRYPNEAQAIKELGGIVIKIYSNKINERSVNRDGMLNHKSEIPLHKDYIDYNIENNGSVKELEDKILEIINGI